MRKHLILIAVALCGTALSVGVASAQEGEGSLPHAGTDIKMTSQVLRGLERKRLLIRDADAVDTRAKRLHVTEAGAKLATVAVAAVEAADAEFFAPVPHGQTLAILTRLAG